jgi:hypothetical protein
MPDLEVVARDGALVALVGNSAAGRTRDAHDSEEAFLSAVALGLADRHTFITLAEATAFAVAKLDNLAQDARRIEAAISAAGGAEATAGKAYRWFICNCSMEEKRLMSR